jgi:uncharacterized delta-60 repeat protein
MNSTRKQLFSLLVFVELSAASLFATGGDLDNTFFAGASTDNPVNAAVFQPDSKIIVGGSFTTYNGVSRNHVARLNSDGSLDNTFNPVAGPNSDVFWLALQPDGRIIITGIFTTYNGVSRNRIARVNPDGSLDTTFNPGTGANTTVYSASVQTDGKIVIGGFFTTYNNVSRGNIARLNADGSLDTNFNPGTGADGIVNTTSVQPDGKVIIGGSFLNYNGIPRKNIARINTSGSLDTNFNPGTGASSSVLSTGLQTDGKIIIGGAFTTYNNIARSHVARLNNDGSIDSTFTPSAGANGDVLCTKLQTDGSILIGGAFTAYDGVTRNRIALLGPNGFLELGFDSSIGASNNINTIALQTDGRIIIGGAFSSYNGFGPGRVARLLPFTAGALSFSSTTNSVNEGTGNALITVTRAGGSDDAVAAKIVISDGTTTPSDYVFAPGALDASFVPGAGANNQIYAAVLQPDGKILIGGEFTSYNGVSRNRIARVNPDGSLDSTFDPGAGVDEQVGAVALQPDGRIIIGGTFTTYDGTTRNGVARLNADGSLDRSFTLASGIQDASVVALQPDGKILIGNFFAANNTGIARLNPDGSLDNTFNPGTGATGGGQSVLAIALQLDAKIIIGGDFTSYNGTGRTRLARLNADGSLDTSFDPGNGADLTVRAVRLLSDGKLIIGGFFSNYSGVARSHIARVNHDGSTDSSFNPGTGTNAGLNDLVLQPDGKIIMCGSFHSYNAVSRNGVARANTDGSLDTSFNPGSGTGTVQTVALQSDGRIIIGGAFISYNGVARNRIARVHGDLFAVWSAGDITDKVIQLPVVDDTLVEGNETLTLTINAVIGGATLGNIATQTLTIVDNEQSITFTALAGKTFGDPPFALSATASSGLPVSFQILSGPATISGTTVTVTGAGTVTVRASQAGDGDHHPAAPVDRSFAVGKAETSTLINSSANPSQVGQSVTFTATVIYGAGAVTGSVQFKADGANLGSAQTLNANGVASVSTSLLDVGTHTITADYGGNSNFIASSGNLAGGQAVNVEPTPTPATSPTPAANPTATVTPTPTPSARAGPNSLLNISTRLQVGTDDNVLIAGFIIQGTESKKVIVRGIGPSLARSGVSGVLSNPHAALYSNGDLGQNDDWKLTMPGGVITGDQKDEIEATGLAPTEDNESAIVATLAPGFYTAIISGVNKTTGVGLAEVYDLAQVAEAKVANISTRGFVQTGDQVMIGGFIIGNRTIQVIVRAIGPSLTAFGVANALADPTLELYNGFGTRLGANDNWRDDHEEEIQAITLAPTSDAESAIVQTLAPGSYTAIVRGKSETSGVALVEVYNFEQ